jgi:O-antigen/teichoic acid export membrane protein
MFSLKSKFSRNVFVLSSGTALSQVIPFIVLPILQKYFYGPADFAMLATFVYFSEMVGVISTLKLEYAVGRQSTPQEARELVSAGFRVVGVSSIVSLVLAAVCFFFDMIHGLHALGAAIFLLPLVVWCMGVIQLTSYWFNVRQEYTRMASNKMIQTVSGESLKLAHGWAGFNFVGLIAGRVAGMVIVAVMQIRMFTRQAIGIERRNVTVWSQLVKNKAYVLYTTPSVFVGAFINFLFLELFLTHYGSVSAGMISVAMTYVGAGLGVMAGSISQVYYGTIARIHSRSEMQRLYVRFLGRLIVLAAVMTLMFWVLPASWVVGVLGPEWNELMVYCRIISIWLGVWFVSSSLSFIYMHLQRQREMLVFDALHVVLVYAGFHAGRSWGGNDIAALWGFTWAQVISYAIAIVLAIYFIRITPLLRND